MSFAAGKKTWGICDISGFRYRLKDMKKTWDGFLVGPDQWSPKQPQLEAPRVGPDPQAVKDPRPDRTEPVAEALLTNNPFLSTSGSAVIKVFECDHGRSTGDEVRFRGADAFDGITTIVLESASGYTITVVDANEYKFTATGTATTGDITGGGSIATAGPV